MSTPFLLVVTCCLKHREELCEIENHYALQLSEVQHSNLERRASQVKIDLIKKEVTLILQIFSRVILHCQQDHHL